MPRFTIVPEGALETPIELEAVDAGSVLHRLSTRDFETAHVLSEGNYLFSVRLAEGGCWTIFKRGEAADDQFQPFA